ncbi:MAG: hypothetical protein WD066_20355 [Planctomycetaceae bacterium]
MAPVRLWCVALAATLLAGCESMPKFPTFGEMLHNLQPHRIAHLNRGAAPGRGDTFYSVPDTIPEFEEPE